MMGFQPVVLWTDLLLFGLLGCIVLAAWSARRSEPMRAAWGRVGASGVGMTSLTLLLVFVLVGLVDSLHYRERLEPAGAEAAEARKAQLSTEVRSALDALAEPLRTRVEKTYSAPLAWQLFSKQTVEGKDGTQHREFPRLKYGGAGLQYPEQDLVGDVMGRIAIGLATAAGGWLVLAGVVVALVAWSRRVPFGAGWRAVWRGKGGLAWRAMLLTLAGVLLLVGPITALATEYHVFGTDKVGQDVFYQILKSVRTALVIGLVTALIVTGVIVTRMIVTGRPVPARDRLRRAVRRGPHLRTCCHAMACRTAAAHPAVRCSCPAMRRAVRPAARGRGHRPTLAPIPDRSSRCAHC